MPFHVARKFIVVMFAICACGCAIRPASRDATVSPPLQFFLDDPPASTWTEVTFRPIDAEGLPAAQQYVQMVRQEFARQSPALIRRSGLREIVIVDNLKVRGQLRAAVPDYPLGRLYLDPSVGNWSAIYQRHAIHHDFFHLIQGHVHDDAYFKDANWIALNPPGIEYGTGGASSQIRNAFAMTHPATGFVNLYSQSAVEEDMAEIFAMLFVEDELRLLNDWAETDQILRAKLRYVRSLIWRYES
jgi:hypothetical protein